MKRALFALLLAPAFAAQANNGLLFIGFGSESLNMGGADIAVARDTTALNTNPAGLAQLRRPTLDHYVTLTKATGVRHRDALGNDVEVANEYTPTFGLGYARRIEGSRLTWGAGVFVQGGAGNKFENLATTAGTRDELSARLAIFKLGPGLAYEASERLRLGASVALVVGTLEQKLFPDTSLVAPAPFFGIDASDLRATGINARFGLQYAASDRLTLAAVFSPKTRLDFKDGRLRSNQAAAGFGSVTYEEARIEGFALPNEASLGAAWKALGGRLLISAKLAWLNWNDALDRQTLTASNPSGPAAAPSLSRESPLDWKDQHVLALGAAYTTAARTTLYAGVNLANNPVPPQTLTPVLSPAIARKHLTGGFAHPLGSGYTLSGGALYVFREKVSYSNPALALLGPTSEEQIGYFGLNLMLGKTW